MLFRLLSLATFLLAAVLLFLVPFLVRGRSRKIAALLAGGIAALVFADSEEIQYQHRFDYLRARHLATFARQIDAYRQQTGHCPLASAAGPLVVRLHAGPLPADPGRYDGAVGTVRDAGALRKELRRVLGEQVQLPVDPQGFRYAYLVAPNWYLYRVDGDRCELTGWLFHHRPCTSDEGYGRQRLTVGTAPGDLSADQVDACLPPLEKTGQ